MNNSTPQLKFAALSGAVGKEIIVDHEGGDLTIDAGLILLGDLDRRLGLCERMAAGMKDRRHAGKRRHSFADMVRARVAGLCMGYSDCNDLNWVRQDAAFLLFCGQSPLSFRRKQSRSAGEDPVAERATTEVPLTEVSLTEVPLTEVPLAEVPLPTQPTLSRFENAPGSRDLYRMGIELARQCIAQLPQSTQCVTLEFDSSVDPCHGGQELEFFNGFYDCHCYLPLYCHLVDAAGKRYQLACLLRPGNVAGTKGVKALTSRGIKLIREHLPKAKIRVRCDSGFGENDILSFLEKGTFLQRLDGQKIEYAFGLPQNKVLHALSADLERDACLRYSQTKVHWAMLHRLTTKDRWRKRLKKVKDAAKDAALAAGQEIIPSAWEADRDSAEPWSDEWECTEYGSVYYQAGTWKEPRRVVVSASVVTNPATGLPELNTRYVVSNLMPPEIEGQKRAWNARDVYHFYCERGEQENRIKEFKLDMDGGRTSCHRFLANQFRLLLHSAATLLMNVLQAKLPKNSAFKNPQIATLRNQLLKVAARVTVSCRRICVRLASSFRHFEVWNALSRAIANTV